MASEPADPLRHLSAEEKEQNERLQRISAGYSSSGPKERKPPSSPLSDLRGFHLFPVGPLLNETTNQGLRRNQLKEEVKAWLDEHKVEYTLDIRPYWATNASTITIVDHRMAVLFKLRWM